MKVFRKLRIRTKLIILILFLAGCTLVVGILGYAFAKKSHKALTNVHDENLKNVELLNDVRTENRANLSNALKLMLPADKEGQDTINGDIEQRMEMIENDLAEYEKSDLDEFEAKQYERIMANNKAWNLAFQNIRDYTKTGNTADAFLLFQETGETVFEDMQTGVRELVNYNMEEADAAYIQTNIAYRETIQYVSVVVLCAALISILAGVLITRSITEPIARLVSCIKESSDLDSFYNDNTYESLMQYKGEIGTIADSVFNMIKSLRNTDGQITAVSDNLTLRSQELSETSADHIKDRNQTADGINEIAEESESQPGMTVELSAAENKIPDSTNMVNKEIRNNAPSTVQSLDIAAKGQETTDLTLQKIFDNISVSGKLGDSIRELTELIQKVNDVSGLINEMVLQNNLVSYNAVLDAVKDGNLLNGFDVVTEEIKKLAESSVVAAKDITEAFDKTSGEKISMETVQKIVEQQEQAVNISKEVYDRIKDTMEEIF